MLKQNKLHFTGSKDRLKRIVQKNGGDFLPERQLFRVRLQKPYYGRKHRNIGSNLSFQAHCGYIRDEEGFLLTYRIWPTAVTVIRMLLWLALFGVVLWMLYRNTDLTAVRLWSLLGIGPVLRFFWDWYTCRQLFWEMFGKETGPKKRV